MKHNIKPYKNIYRELFFIIFEIQLTFIRKQTQFAVFSVAPLPNLIYCEVQLWGRCKRHKCYKVIFLVTASSLNFDSWMIWRNNKLKRSKHHNYIFIWAFSQLLQMVRWLHFRRKSDFQKKTDYDSINPDIAIRSFSPHKSKQT